MALDDASGVTIADQALSAQDQGVGNQPLYEANSIEDSPPANPGGVSSPNGEDAVEDEGEDAVEDEGGEDAVEDEG